MSNILNNLKTSNLLSNLLYQDTPLYVQYYITARCNLRCEQCNIIYANSDVSECDQLGAEMVIQNLAAIGTQVILLTGGEPFMRTDLPNMVQKSINLGIHPRIQTNGYASEAALEKVAAAGANDISISLDSMKPNLQDKINGGFDETWSRAIKTAHNVSKIFPKNTFAAFGCVLAPSNLDQITNVIRFATEIGWWVSLVPAHSTDQHLPKGFRTFDKSLVFHPELFPKVQSVLSEVRELKSQGFNVYDSDQYLDDIEKFITNRPIRWRDRNNGVCDSPGSYFAVLPNGEMAICCDWRFENKTYSLKNAEFVSQYKARIMFPEAISIASKCSGCMYGSYPEITVTSKFAKASLMRANLFLRESQVSIKQVSSLEELQEIAYKYDE